MDFSEQDSTEKFVRSFSPGDEFQVALMGATEQTVTCEEWVYPDRTCGQFDTGWCVYPKLAGVEDDEWLFVSISGVVYDGTETVGKVVQP